jgi:hypothetical protein
LVEHFGEEVDVDHLKKLSGSAAVHTHIDKLRGAPHGLIIENRTERTFVEGHPVTVASYYRLLGRAALGQPGVSGSPSSEDEADLRPDASETPAPRAAG